MLSEKTYKLYLRILKEFFANKEKILFDKNNLLIYFNNLPATSQRTAIAALRYFKFDFNLDEEEIVGLKKNYKIHTNKKEFNYMTIDHINKLKIYLSKTTEKEKIILMTLFELGVRKFEVQKVIEKFIETQNSNFNIVGKKGTVRKIYLTIELMNLYKIVLKKFSKEQIIKWCSLDSVYNITKKCFKIIGFFGACHDFRRHFAQNLDEKGERLSVIKTLMGHSNIATTSIYIRQNDNELINVIQNQHKQKPTIDVKQHIELTNRVEQLIKLIDEKDKMINNLLKTVEEVVNDNNDLKNKLKSIENRYKRLKNSNKEQKEQKRIETLIKRKINKYEKEQIKNISYSC